jgi:hypothetical protein
MSRTWSIEERISAYEQKKIIDPPLTPDERSVVESLAAAWYFVWELTELPGRFPAKSRAAGAVDMAISRFLMHKDRAGSESRTKGGAR